METRVAQVIDVLVAGTRALPGFRYWSDVTTAAGLTTVFDGAEHRATDDHAEGSLLIVGWPGDDADAVELAATTSLSSGPIAATNRPRDEVGTVQCKAISQNKETQKQARDGALAVITAVASFCRADPSLGIQTSDTIGGVRTIAWVTAGTLAQYLRSGYVAEWDFTVTFKTRV